MQNIPGHQSEWFKATYSKQIPYNDPRYRQQLIDVSGVKEQVGMSHN